MKKHNVISGEEGEDEAFVDQYLLFELNVANEMAKSQSQNLAYIEEDDSREEILFKHHMTLRSMVHNLGSLND